jgi:hypothetical protein
MELLKLLKKFLLSSSANLTSTFTVPTPCFSGSNSYESVNEIQCAQTACEAFSYGEVEDYTVNIGAAAQQQLQLLKSQLI